MKLPNIEKPTLLLDSVRVQNNIQRMVDKARQQGIRFRPHFKTHQSEQIGEWFREQGVNAITVSSVDMALYFADRGWEDITIAFPVNWRQLEKLWTLAKAIRLGLLVESVESADWLDQNLSTPVNVWIEVDEGSGRSGVPWDDTEPLLEIAKRIRGSPDHQLKGLLTHAGRIYGSNTVEEIKSVYSQAVQRMNQARDFLRSKSAEECEISIGDTPGCSLVSDLGEVDEIRPGNFVFYDSQQLRLGSCQPGDIGVVLACPVVAKYPARSECVIYGGAIHLSKDTVVEQGRPVYGLVASHDSEGWGAPVPGGYVARLSQEHGVVHLPEPYFSQVSVGDILLIIPAHSCLSVSALSEYYTLDGEIIPAFHG
jgi:D-serine deaminase-like pyridoxal phosphate-dependent protein